MRAERRESVRKYCSVVDAIGFDPTRASLFSTDTMSKRKNLASIVVSAVILFFYISKIHSSVSAATVELV